MRYQDCKAEELEQFMKNRNLSPPKDASTARRSNVRRNYISCLQGADRNATLDFSELPPELRNEVYDYVLNPDSTAYRPHIVSVSKQIYQEAIKLLFADRAVSTVAGRKVEVQGETAPKGVFYGEVSLECTYDTLKYVNWPDFLRTAKRLYSIFVTDAREERIMTGSRPERIPFSYRALLEAGTKNIILPASERRAHHFHV